MRILESLLPIALLIVLGAGLLRFRFLDEAVRQGLDRLVYWVALPALIVGVLADAPPPGVLGSAAPMALTLCGATAVVAAIGWLFAKGSLPRTEAGVFTQAAFRGNLAFVGLPAIGLAVGGGPGGEALLAKAALVFAPTVVLYNVLSVTVLVAAQHRIDASLPGKMLLTLASNPLLIACGVGLGLWYQEVSLPSVATTTLQLLGKPAATLALISLGAVLASYPVGKRVNAAALASAFKCVATPAVAWGLAMWLGLPTVDRQIVLIFAACPTAVASYVLATQLGGDPGLAAASIVLSTLVSGLSLGVILAMT